MKAYHFLTLFLGISLLISCVQIDLLGISSYVDTGKVVKYSCDRLEVTGKISKAVYVNGLYPSEYGIVYSPDRGCLDVDDANNSVSSDSNIYGSLTDFQMEIYGLLPNRTYYYRAYVYIGGIYYYGPTRSAKTPDLKFKNVSIEYSDLTYYSSSGQRIYTYHFSCDLSNPCYSPFDLDYNGVGSSTQTTKDYLLSQGNMIDDDFKIRLVKGQYTYNNTTKTFSTKGMKINMDVCLSDYFNNYELVPVYSCSFVLPE